MEEGLMPGSDLTTPQKVILILALFGLGYLLLQLRSEPLVLSNWQSGRSVVPKSVGLSGEAAPQTGRGLPGDPDTPLGNPLRSPRTVMTQGYGVGTHAPAAIWGGVDLAIDGDGNGQADPKGTADAPIYATHAGIAHVKPDTWPAGNYLAIEADGYKTAYAHLSRYAIRDGQQVERGDLIGYVGSTGQSTGPHLHYEVWKEGVNVNPLDYGALDGARQR
jgi:murein DD-endopeptidase MepM/ murein hydrolase activator NlpD